MLDFSVSYRGTTHRLALEPDTPLSELEVKLAELTGVPVGLQKLLFKGKKAGTHGDVTMSELGIKNGVKVQMLGTTTKELDGLKDVESEQQRRARIMRERAMKPQDKACAQIIITPAQSTASGSRIATLSSPSASNSTFKFHQIVPLAHLPNPEQARSTLQKLASDPAILHVMQKHQFTVGTLTELAPHEQPHLLGLNVNAGESIKLRIYTDRYDGFRSFKEMRRVLCHELTHNVWGDHDNNFKELNSQLNREVVEFERASIEGTHSLSGDLGSIFPSVSSELEAEAEAEAYVLGGSSTSLAADSQEERRRRILEATMNRLRKEEEEIEHSCGTRGTA
ncbi:WLM-domain-containing protein [Coprinellus micaceus]|uniref:WLM-domain-containing protein n=1 Tax=Coprinellus micaceus TaxID=71717 RepID=A0A4Y7TGZ8_COPMI|nr:WLM-domain-containing protein [Coprinellus micaceus]